MITSRDLYNILSAVVPLYVTMLLAYASVRWGKIFNPEQCSGINRLVYIFILPIFSFQFISHFDPFAMDYRFVTADTVSKIAVLLLLLALAKLSPWVDLDESIVAFSLVALPNTLVMGLPLIKSMYGDNHDGLMTQVVAMQVVVWYTFLLFLLEYRAARTHVLENVSEGISDDGREIQEQELVHVIIERKNSSEIVQANHREQSLDEEASLGEAASSNNGGLGEDSVQVCCREDENGGVENNGKKANLPKRRFGSIIRVVGLKLIKNPNIYAGLLGLSWALASSRLDIKKPLIIENSITLLSNAGLGMAMFSLGLFMASQPKIIACGKRLAAYGMFMRFVVGPATMAIASVVLGIRGTTLKISIVQAALPQGIGTFVFAREYNLHPELFSTAVVFGMIVSLPVTILYYILLGLNFS